MRVLSLPWTTHARKGETPTTAGHQCMLGYVNANTMLVPGLQPIVRTWGRAKVGTAGEAALHLDEAVMACVPALLTCQAMLCSLWFDSRHCATRNRGLRAESEKQSANGWSRADSINPLYLNVAVACTRRSMQSCARAMAIHLVMRYPASTLRFGLCSFGLPALDVRCTRGAGAHEACQRTKLS